MTEIMDHDNQHKEREEVVGKWQRERWEGQKYAFQTGLQSQHKVIPIQRIVGNFKWQREMINKTEG